MECSARGLAEDYLQKLRKKGNEEQRINTARLLYNYVNGELRDNTSQFINEFISAFDAKVDQSVISEMINSADNDDRKAGIFLIVCLVESAGDEGKRVPRFSKYLLKALTTGDEAVIMLSARAIVYLIQTSKTFAVELVEKSLNQVCEWLEESERNESRRFAAVLLARQLALHTSAPFFLRASEFFNNIFRVIKDPKVHIRIAATEALRAAFAVTSQREARQKVEWYRRCYDEAINCLSYEGLNREDRYHPALLILNELLRISNEEMECTQIEALSEELHQTVRTVIGSNAIDWLIERACPNTVESQTARFLVIANFREIINVCFRAISIRSSYCQLILLEIYPRLFSFQENDFESEFFKNLNFDPVPFFLHALSIANKYPSALFAIGLLMLYRSTELISLIPKLFSAIQTFTVKRKQVDDNVFICLMLVVRALKEKVESNLRNLLPQIFSTGLSKGLTNVSDEIMRWIPGLKTEVQDALLRELYQLLLNQKFPSKLDPPSKPPLPTGSIFINNISSTRLALSTLGRFNFQRHSLQMFISYIAYGHLVCDHVSIRLAAVECCYKVLLPFIKVFELGNRKQRINALDLIHPVIKQLVSLAVVDPSVDVRSCVLRTFKKADRPFLSHMANPELVDIIFMTLHDEKLEIREESVVLLMKLGGINAAHVLPRLKNVLSETLMQIENSSNARLEEHSAVLITQIASQKAFFVRPYMSSILNSLIPKLRIDSRHVDVTVQVLNAISELASAGGVDLIHELDSLLSLLIQFLQDASSVTRREAALRALGRICQNTGYVVDPYQDYPELLDILLKLLKTEMNMSMRRATMRVLGVIGALDPYTHKVYTGKVQSIATNSKNLSLPTVTFGADVRDDIIQWFHYERFTLVEFYPALAIASLMQMLKDDALSHLRKTIIQSLLTIMSSMGSNRTQYVDKVVPRLLEITQNEVNLVVRQFYLQQIANLVSIVGTSMKPYMPKILSIISDAWCDDAGIRLTVVNVMNQIGKAFGTSFAPYVADLCPYLLKVVQTDRTNDRVLTCAAFSCVQSISACLAPYLNLIIPPVLSVLDDSSIKITIRQMALDTIYQMSNSLCFRDHAPSVMQVWLRVISVPSLQSKLLSLLIIIVKQMWKRFMVFRPIVDQSISRFGLKCPEYVRLSSELDDENALVPIFPAASTITPPDSPPLSKQQSQSRSEKSQRINFDLMKKYWKISHLTSKEDWDQWLNVLRAQFIRQSPSAAVRACAPLADIHPPLAKDLFNAAFMSLWTELDESQQSFLEKNLKNILDTSSHADIIQTFLNLAEFMDHSERGPLPVGNERLSRCAEKTHAYAKALRYTELNIRETFGKNPDPEQCRALITYANELNLDEEAAGVVAFAKKHNIEICMEGRWYERLNEWEKALEIYADVNSVDDDRYIHKMRCLEVLGQWEELKDLSRKTFHETSKSLDSVRLQKMAIIAARGSWAIGDWDSMNSYVEQINANSQDGSFLRAVLCIHNSQYDSAYTYIDKVRDMFDADLTAMASESYERAYGAMTLVQQLTELEESIEYKLYPDRRLRIGVTWSRRLQGCRQNIEQWQRMLFVRSTVLTENEMQPLWIKFSSLCRRQGKLAISRRILKNVLGMKDSSEWKEINKLPMDEPSLVLAVCKQLWTEMHETHAYGTLEKLVHHLEQNEEDIISNPELSHVAAKCCLKLGDWNGAISSMQVLHPPIFPSAFIPPPTQMHFNSHMQKPVVIPTIYSQSINYYSLASNFDPNWYKAWHKLATAYYNSVFCITKNEVHAGQGAHLSSPAVETSIAFYAVQAVKCFVNTLKLAKGSRLEYLLRFLTLWFKYSDNREVYENVHNAIKALSVDVWLEVIPQLMARLDSVHNVAQLIKQVLIDLSKTHPQSLLYPLTMAARSRAVERSTVAHEILSLMSVNNKLLVEQAKLVTDELIRCAILWHEQWHEALDEASKLFFQERDVQGMLDILEPLHHQLEQGATTSKEQSFKQTYENELKEAWNACLGYMRTQNPKELNQAWDLYYSVFGKITAQLPHLLSLDLTYIAPRLLKAQNLLLSVPGTYDPDSPLVTIISIGNHLQVISSKQRPRKVIIRGSDGNNYTFLLKGHEDPRQDERVMQLFGLVNTLLLHESDTSRRNLTIQRYPIISLNQNIGLIGWLPNCDTLHALIRDYRDKKNILLSMEHKIMLAFATKIEKLNLFQKVQVFEHALQMTHGNDLQQIIWLKSPDSEVWFDRRTNYTRSLACMSMVGYILGLGDRHPSNLMLDRISGKIVHIDFGDCFEVAVTREKFPEKIPFRLTRMLVQAMEVTGIEGNYRITCERVMRVLRSNRESLLAVLEAFVYDPLINWRLMEGSRRPPPENNQKDGQTDTKAELSLKRIQNKLSGRDFLPNVEYSVSEQVAKLIDQATSSENLCQCYVGWCPFW